MADRRRDESPRLAPVTPLFDPGRRKDGADAPAASPPRNAPTEGPRPGGTASARWRPVVLDEGGDGAEWHPTWQGAGDDADVDAAAGGSEAFQAAESQLLRRLRAKSLSMKEARALLASSALDVASIDAILRGAQRHGYLDDAAVADQVVHSAVERQGRGRRAISQELSRRGIPRELVDAALAELPDDDDERALQFARTKARAMSRLDRETAMRRLMGQLSRRGYPSAVALRAAAAALDDATGPRGVAFAEDPDPGGR